MDWAICVQKGVNRHLQTGGLACPGKQEHPDRGGDQGRR